MRNALPGGKGRCPASARCTGHYTDSERNTRRCVRKCTNGYGDIRRPRRHGTLWGLIRVINLAENPGGRGGTGFGLGWSDGAGRRWRQEAAMAPGGGGSFSTSAAMIFHDVQTSIWGCWGNEHSSADVEKASGLPSWPFGLPGKAARDTARCPMRMKATDEQRQRLHRCPHGLHGDWNNARFPRKQELRSS